MLVEGLILERSRGDLSWIQIGDRSLGFVLQGIEDCCKRGNLGSFSSKWEEDARKVERFVLVFARKVRGFLEVGKLWLISYDPWVWIIPSKLGLKMMAIFPREGRRTYTI